MALTVFVWNKIHFVKCVSTKRIDVTENLRKTYSITTIKYVIDNIS